jgi:hypothetical protein
MIVSTVNDCVLIMWNILAPSSYAFHILATHRRYVYQQNRLKYNGTSRNLTCTTIDLHFYLYQWAKDNLIAVFCLFSHRWPSKATQNLKADLPSCAHSSWKSLGKGFIVWSRRKLQIKVLSCASEVLLCIHLE